MSIAVVYCSLIISLNHFLGRAFQHCDTVFPFSPELLLQSLDHSSVPMFEVHH